MKIETPTGNVTSIGAIGASNNFSIAMNAKAFRLLSDTLYQDKIGSIVRELSCNALDAHVMAGKGDVPITIHVPDQFEPWLSFTDTGIGMSPETVQTVYATYFESTKNNNNNEIGGFGIGGKVFFSYTDQFNITSNWNGKKYSFSAFINSTGMPEIQLMAETDTDEPNGVQVKGAIKPEDFRKVYDSVRSQLRFFKTKPEVVNYSNNAEFTWAAQPESLFESASINVFKNAGYGTRIHVVQGPVGYPLDYNQIVNSLDADEKVFLTTIQNIGANLYFNIGEIGVTASREGVEYNSFTINNIKSKLADARAELVAWIENEIAALPNVYEKAKFLNDNTAFRTIINGINLDMAPAKKLSNGYHAFHIAAADGFSASRKYTNNYGVVQDIAVRLIKVTKYSAVTDSGFRAGRNSSDDDVVIPEKNRRIVIAIRDTNKTPVARMRHYFNTHSLTHLYMLHAIDDDAKMDDKFIKNLSKHLGGFADIVRVSDMPEAPKVSYAGGRGAYSRPTAYKLDHRIDFDSVCDWDREYVKLADMVQDEGIEEAVYVTVERQRIIDVDWQIANAYEKLHRAGMTGVPVYGIRVNDVDKLKDTDCNWITLKEYVKSKTAAINADKSLQRYIRMEAIANHSLSVVGQRMVNLEGLNRNTGIAKMISIHKRAKDYVTNNAVDTALKNLCDYDPSNHFTVKVLRKHDDGGLFDKVPMLNYVSRHGYGGLGDDEAKHIVEYINHFAS